MILITGATGNVGRPLIELLVREGATVRDLTRDSQANWPSGIEIVVSDPSRPDNIAAALRGVDSVFVNPRAVGTAVAELLPLPRHGVVRKVVVGLSAINVDDPVSRQRSRFRGDRNKEAEDAAIASGLDWISLRPTTFATNA